MARSQYIYVLMTDMPHDEPVVMAAFTVKHEALTAMRKHREAKGICSLEMKLWRVRDNGKILDQLEAVAEE